MQHLDLITSSGMDSRGAWNNNGDMFGTGEEDDEIAEVVVLTLVLTKLSLEQEIHRG